MPRIRGALELCISSSPATSWRACPWAAPRADKPVSDSKTTQAQLVDKPSLRDKQFLYAGGARGGKARLESDQMSRKALPCKACVERSDYFRAARRHKNNDIISGCRKSQRLFRQPERGSSQRTAPLQRSPQCSFWKWHASSLFSAYFFLNFIVPTVGGEGISHPAGKRPSGS